MCGIVGVFCFRHDKMDLGRLERMTDTLRHRGPDDRGYLVANVTASKAEEAKDTAALRTFFETKHPDLGVGHRRLSIIDLSEAGHQPMGNENGSVWIVHNGEIYNYIEIRSALEALGHRFKSGTDTEVILHAYEEWGTDCLVHFNGMWAFAIIDLVQRQIFCARDRAGVKPFYYFLDARRFCFASEIKALLEMEDFRREPNDQAVADYLFSGLLDHTAETFFKNIRQLRPGEYLLFKGDHLTVRSYWDIEPKELRLNRERGYVDQFYSLFEDAVRLRLRSDVPIGSCLSGGLDSSSIVCVANRLMFEGTPIHAPWVGERQKTFSSCFEDSAYDERNFIELVIRQTQAEKNYVFPKGEALFKEMDRVIWHQEEPFGSTSIYAQWNVMRLAREKGVTVLLDGQGGDELLAGYPPSFYSLFRELIKQAAFGQLLRETMGFLKKGNRRPDQFVSRMIAALMPAVLKPLFQSLSQSGFRWADANFRKRHQRKLTGPNKFGNELNNYLYHIFRSTVLPGLLHYEDRNSMAHSLETRLPFLDYRMVEFAFSLPVELKLSEGVTKVILRKAMEGILPEGIRNRADKMGFVTPEDIWFKTVLRDPICRIIHSKSFAERGYFDVPDVLHAFDDHCEGKANISFVIWRWVNLELWFRIFIDRIPFSTDQEDNERSLSH